MADKTPRDIPIQRVGQSINPQSFFGKLFNPITKRLTQAVVAQLSGGWFTPENPQVPIVQQTAGRQFDYPAGYNLRIRPERESRFTGDNLRGLAQSWDLLRLVIETRKDQLESFDWTIAARKKTGNAKQEATADQQARIDACTTFFHSPDKTLNFSGWLRALLEDSFVLDGIVLWPVFQGKQLYALERIDANTIKMVIDEKGRKPSPPYPAYQQILHGVVANEYRTGELLYYMRNPRNNSVYGYSPVEQIIMTIQMALNRQLMTLSYFTEGNIPEAIAQMPENWTGEQISMFQRFFDNMLAGNVEQRAGNLKFIPFGPKIEFMRKGEQLLKQEFDEWLARIVCYAFSLSPSPFIKQMNRATAESAQEAATEEGLFPLFRFLKGIMDDILANYMASPDLEFRWDLQQDVDAQLQAKIDDTYVKNGVWSIDEVRIRQGKEPLGIPNLIFTSQGPVPVSMYAGDQPSAPNLQPKQAPPQVTDQSGDGEEPEQNGHDQNADQSVGKLQGARAGSLLPFRQSKASHPHGRKGTY